MDCLMTRLKDKNSNGFEIPVFMPLKTTVCGSHVHTFFPPSSPIMDTNLVSLQFDSFALGTRNYIIGFVRLSAHPSILLSVRNAHFWYCSCDCMGVRVCEGWARVWMGSHAPAYPSATIPVMATVAVRKKVVSTGHFSLCFYLAHWYAFLYFHA